MKDSNKKHNHSAPSLKSINNAFYIGIGLNSIFTLIEFVIGYSTNSLALIADASHNLSDVASLIISLIGLKLAQKATSTLYTYGYKKASILASLFNAILLILIVINIINEGVERLDSLPEVAGLTMMITALIGVFINTVSAFLFFKGQKDDINIKGAFIHLLVDAIVSLGVVISGIVIYYTEWNIVDPIISFVIAIVILISTWSLFKESIRLVLDAVPKNIDNNKITELLDNNQYVQSIHHLHIWALSSNENAMTVHIILKEGLDLNNLLTFRKSIKEELIHMNIQHVTIELETSTDRCEEIECK